MMTWSYRIVRYHSGEGYGLHEVYYDEEGLPWTMTENAISFACDTEEGPEGIKESLSKALECATNRPILVEPPLNQWPGKAPNDES